MRRKPLAFAVLWRPLCRVSFSTLLPGASTQNIVLGGISPCRWTSRFLWRATGPQMGPRKRKSWDMKRSNLAVTNRGREENQTNMGAGVDTDGLGKQCMEESSASQPGGAQRRGWVGRKVFEGVHPGSYAGELSKTLSEERQRELKERKETDAKAAQDATDQEGAGGEESGTKAIAVIKRKVALLVAYTGSAYQGLQINEGASSIEAEVELAIYLAGGMSTDNFGNLRKVSWSRAGRTDKGVHAAGQVIALKLKYPSDKEKEMVEGINHHLPGDIRVLDIKRVTKAFDARDRCTGRRYEYMMPTFVLAPKEEISTTFAEALAWEKAEAEAEANSGSVVDATACGADGAAPSGTRGAKGAGTTGAVSVDAHQENGGGSPHLGGDDEGVDEFDAAGEGRKALEAREGDTKAREFPQEVELSSAAVLRRVGEKLAGYKLPESSLEMLRETLGVFKGTKNYHNYTRSKAGTDDSCKRYVTSFAASDPWKDGQMEWIRVTVEGQSFLLHQIRKMVAASVDRVRGHSSKEDLEKSFSPLVKFNLGLAPSQGLYLERVLYSTYNTHVRGQGAPERMLEWETGPVAEALEEFKRSRIQAGILAKERHDHDFVAWLDRINRYPCPYQPLGKSGLLESQQGNDTR